MRTEYIERREMEHVLATLMPTNRLVLEVAMHTGLRVGDVLAMRTDKLASRMYVREAKTGKTRRISLTRDLLDRMIAQAGKIWVFEGRCDYRRHRTRQAVWLDLRRSAELLRVKAHIGPHSTRKIYAVDALRRAGGDLGAVQRLMGHSDPAVTMIYAMADHLTQGLTGRRATSADSVGARR